MERFFSAVRPIVTMGGIHHFIYLVIIVALLLFIITFRRQLRTHEKVIMAGILVIAILQRILSFTYFAYIDAYTLAESLPLHICRLVCILIIIQFFLKKDWLDQVIFFWGLFAYASFIYPVDISPPTHVMGITFVILHSLNILFPLVRHFTAGFMPSFKGSVIAAALFAVYLPLMAIFNEWTGGNYFYMVERPFFYDMADVPYFLINFFGVCTAFLLIGLIFSVLTKNISGRIKK